MAEHSIHILSTRPVDPSQVQDAKLKGIQIDIISFIETEAIQTIEVQQEIEWASTEQAAVVFTSMNAVESVTAILDGFIPTWRIYCIGFKTKELITNYFGADAIAGTADNASELADTIIENEEYDEIIFFCGNQRRDALPRKLRKLDIDVNEIVVYETITVHNTVDKKYDGILFFSPSAVESFFKKNVLPKSTVVFAIGNTTAETVHKRCPNKILISDQPGKDELVAQAILYFS
jgi:uroporphyrinogen-III synthase